MFPCSVPGSVELAAQVVAHGAGVPGSASRRRHPRAATRLARSGGEDAGQSQHKLARHLHQLPRNTPVQPSRGAHARPHWRATGTFFRFCRFVTILEDKPVDTVVEIL